MAFPQFVIVPGKILDDKVFNSSLIFISPSLSIRLISLIRLCVLSRRVPERISHPPKTRSFGFEGAIPIIVQCVADVGIGLLSAWLYDKLKKGKSKTVTIDFQKIEITPEAITKFISEKMTIEQGGD